MTPRSARVAAAVLLALAAFALYASSAAPGILWGDTAEMQAAAATFGIPHSTGYPTFVLVGGLFAKLGAGNPAFAVNLMSSTFGALSLALLVLVCGELGIGLAASTTLAAVYGLTFTVWRIALRAEVYTLAVALGLAALLVTLRAHRTGRFGLALLAATLLGLTVTGHFAFALPVAVAGASLAWRTARTGSRPALRLAALLAAFLVGFLPYLQTWLADAHGAPVNYLQMVRDVVNPYGAPMPDFDTGWKRVLWLMTSANKYPHRSLAVSPRQLVVGSLEAGFVLFYFQLGPAMLPLALAGIARLFRRARATALLFLAAGAVSVLFTAALVSGAMAHLFLLPAILLTVVFAAAGLDAVLERWGGSPARTAAIALLVLALAVVPGPLLREWADAHALTPWRFNLLEETGERDRAWIPNLRGETEPGRYAHRAMELVPRDALVLAGWIEINPLRYAQAAEGLRRDLTLHQATWITVPDRMRTWQRLHDPAVAPFVFTARPPAGSFTPDFAESMEVTPGRWLYVQRTPVPDTLPVARAR